MSRFHNILACFRDSEFLRGTQRIDAACATAGQRSSQFSWLKELGRYRSTIQQQSDSRVTLLEYTEEIVGNVGNRNATTDGQLDEKRRRSLRGRRTV
jgi:hypothetical protein